MRGMLVGIGMVVATAAALVPFRSEVSRTTPALSLVVAVVAAGLVGGRAGAIVTAVVAAVVFNLAFIPPLWTFEVDVLEDIVALAVFVVVAVAVGTLVARESHQRRAAEQHATDLSALHERYAAVAEERERLAEEATRLAVLEQVDAQRSALLRSVSHDLRTPLSTIRAVTSDLRAGTRYDPHTRDELLDLVVDEAERLDRIVANLLSLSRIEAGAFQPQRQALAVDELVSDCVKRLGGPLRNLVVHVDIPEALCLVDADYSQVDQVVTNLLENAARHAPPGSTIRVDAHEESGMVEVAVTDEGPGVAPADRASIFEPFWHHPTASTSGVGLSICRAIVEAHGGTIGMEAPAWVGPLDEASGHRPGVRFVFTLPARATPRHD